MRIIVTRDYEDMSQKTAEIINLALQKEPNIVLGLATGGTPERVYELLVQAYQKKQTNWEKVITFNLDEYIGLAKKHPLSYHQYMQKNLFSKVNLNKANTYLPSGNGNISQNGLLYDKLIKEKGGIDIQLLGIGENAHIGFNEPGSAREAGTHEVELTDSTIKANARYFESIDDVPKKSITMGIGSILRAKKIILIASGAKKAQAIKDTISGPISEKIPSSFLRTHNDVTIIVDQEAAKLIENSN